MIIYKLTSPSGKSYIGQTKSTLLTRWKQHRQKWNGLSDPPYKNTTVKLFYAFDKYPNENDWKLEVLDECLTSEELDEKEMYYIEFYDSINNGYNVTKGGQGVKVDFLTDEHKQNLSKARKDYYDTEDGLEWKNKLSIRYSGENNPMYGKGDEIREQNSRWYLLLDREDNEIIVKNLYKFQQDTGCRTINLFPNCYKSNYASPSEYRGTLLKNYSDELSESEKNNIISEARKLIKPIKKWKLIDPEGNEYITYSLKLFCDSYKNEKLTHQCLGAMARSNSKTITHKGWRCEEIN